MALDFDALKWNGMPEHKAIFELRTRSGWYDPEVLAALEEVVGCAEKFEEACVAVRGVTPEMALAEDVVTVDGLLLVSKG